jgi:hypothetical protein
VEACLLHLVQVPKEGTSCRESLQASWKPGWQVRDVRLLLFVSVVAMWINTEGTHICCCMHVPNTTPQHASNNTPIWCWGCIKHEWQHEWQRPW